MNAASDFHKILVPIDFSEVSLVALSQAVTLGAEFGASISVLHVIPRVESPAGTAAGPDAFLAGWTPAASPDTATSTEMEQRIEAGVAQQLHDLTAHYRTEGHAVDYRVLWGTAFREVIHLVLEEGYDLVVVGSRGRSVFSRMLVGSTAAKLVRKCPCPVWVAKPQGTLPLKAILAPIDLSDVSHKSLHLAGVLAARVNCSLHVLHVFASQYGYLLDLLTDEELDFTPPWHRHEVIAHLRNFVRDSGMTVEPVMHVQRGEVAQQILSVAEQIDAGLIVMGTLGRAGVSGLLIGNTAEKVLHHSELPLLAIKPVGYVSPVVPRFSTVEA